MGMIGNTLAQGLISGANIQDGTVDTPDLKDSAVTAAKIATGTITPNKLVTNSDFTFNGLAVGRGAGAVSTNTAVGLSALNNGSQTGTVNTAIGAYSLFSNTSGTGNTGVGQGAMYLNTTGSSNSSFGDGSLGNNTAGSNNTAIGRQSLTNTTASNNTAVGFQAGVSNTTGALNVFVGPTAGLQNTTGTGNVAIGGGTSGVAWSALQENRTSNYNTMVGVGAGGQYNSSGGLNTFIGFYAGNEITSGSKNTLIGRFGGNSNSIDIRALSNYVVLSDGDGNPISVSNYGVETRQISNTTTRQYGRVAQRGTTQAAWNLLTCSKITGNAFVYIKVRILLCSPINNLAQEIVGYANWGSINGVNPSGSVTTITTVSGSNFNGPMAVGTLSWSGGTLVYTENTGNNYVYFSFFIETCGGDGVTVTYASY